MAPAMATKRLREELIKLKTAPPPGIIADPDESNILKWFYVIRGPSETPFEGGVYIGKLIFPSEYPMKAPSIHMLTPSGRFQINMKICMSMSDFHPESWNPMWSVATIIQGVQSFMVSDELTTGGLRASEADRKKFAKFSSAYNQKNYPNLFDGDIEAALEEAHEICQKAEEETAKTISSSGDNINNGQKSSSSSRRSRRSAKKAGSSSTEQQETNETSEQDAENCTSNNCTSNDCINNGTSSGGGNDPKPSSSRRSRRLAKMAASTEQEQQPNNQDSDETGSNHQTNKSSAAADASIAAITKELSQAEIEKRRKRNEKKRAKQKAKKAATPAVEEST